MFWNLDLQPRRTGFDWVREQGKPPPIDPAILAALQKPKQK